MNQIVKIPTTTINVHAFILTGHLNSNEGRRREGVRDRSGKCIAEIEMADWATGPLEHGVIMTQKTVRNPD